jgi:hypothetical protein
MKLLDASSRMLGVLLWPIVLLEQKLLTNKIAEELGLIKNEKVPIRHMVAAHIERWGLMAVGVMSGSTGTVGFFMATVVMVGFSVAIFIDPLIWASRRMTTFSRGDLKLGLVVNLAPMWMFWLGFMAGMVL